MNINQVRNYFINKDDIPCPLTEKLVKAGYQQRSGGYIDRAITEGIEVDYTQNKPSQYWHLMTYCNSRQPDRLFSKNIVCGELIFWMAEVSGAVEKDEMDNLANRIIESASFPKGDRPIYDRIKWNREIQQLCFDKIVETIEKHE